MQLLVISSIKVTANDFSSVFPTPTVVLFSMTPINLQIVANLFDLSTELIN